MIDSESMKALYATTSPRCPVTISTLDVSSSSSDLCGPCHSLQASSPFARMWDYRWFSCGPECYDVRFTLVK
jgi:hypothetical protein